MTTLMYASEYRKMYQAEERLWWYKGLRNVLEFFVKTYGEIDSRILDAGCGTGKNMEFLISLGYKNVEGFDYSPDAVDFCHKRGLNHVAQHSITQIPYSEGVFDIVYCMDVIGSLEQEGRALAISEMLRVLKPKGLLICNTAALEIFRSQHDDVSNIRKRFSRKELRTLFTGYEEGIKRLTYRVFLLSPLTLLFKIGKRIFGKLAGSDQPKSDQIIFPFGVNWLLTRIQLLENRILKYLDLPFGSSIFVVLIKP